MEPLICGNEVYTTTWCKVGIELLLMAFFLHIFNFFLVIHIRMQCVGTAFMNLKGKFPHRNLVNWNFKKELI